MPILRRLKEGDEAVFVEFLSYLVDEEHFQPHAMDPGVAAKICRHQGMDRYLGYWDDDGTMLAYAILRGWDDGFEHPSLGIAVGPVHRGLGHGLATMEALHAEALALGATQIRLRVHPQNTRARALYEKLGYEFTGDVDRGEDVGWYRIKP